MEKNMGSLDRIIRLIIAGVIAYLYYNDKIPGTLGLILLILMGIFAATSILGLCPLYTLLGINTCAVKKK